MKSHYAIDNEAIYKMTTLMWKTGERKGLDKINIRILMNNDSFHSITHVTLISRSNEQLHLLSNFTQLSRLSFTSRKLNKIFIIETCMVCLRLYNFSKLLLVTYKFYVFYCYLTKFF